MLKPLTAAAAALALAAGLAACKSTARAQDTFVPVGLHSSCEFIHGRKCGPQVKPRRPHVRIVRVPYRVYSAETMPPSCTLMRPLR